MTEPERAVFDAVLKGSATADYPAGRDDLAEHALVRFRSWVAQGYPAAVIRDAIAKALKNGGNTRRDALSLSRYVQSCLNSYAADARGLPDAPPAVPPSQTKPMTYHTASPRPRPAPGPEGAP